MDDSRITDSDLLRQEMRLLGQLVPDDERTQAQQQVGRTIDGYRLKKFLGTGSFGAVYLSENADGELVAIKLLQPRYPSGPPTEKDRQEFESIVDREAGLGTKVSHSRAVSCTLGRDRQAKVSYLRMRYYSGGDLARRMGEFRDPRRAAGLIAELAEVLEAARRSGVVHRDLKPANILFDEQGHPYVADWGLGRSVQDQTLTRSRERAYGTRRYIAPEQIRGLGNADHRSDIYSLGTILYELVTGTPPFRQARSDPEFLNAKRRTLVPRRKRPGVPSEIVAVCSRCTRPASWLRYGSADQVRKDLNRFLRGQPVSVRRHTAMTDAVDWCTVRLLPLTILAVLLLSVSAIAYYRSDANATRRTASLAVAETAELRDTLQENATELDQSNAVREQQSVDLDRREHAALYRRALEHFEQGRTDQAQKLLLRIPPHARTWLWNYAVQLCVPDEEVVADTTIFPRPGSPKNIVPTVIQLFIKPIAVSSDGTQMASIGFDVKGFFFTVRDTRTHTVQRRIPIGESGLLFPAFSPDNSRLAASGKDAIVIWDLATLEETARHPMTKRVRDLRYTPDGLRLIATMTGDGQTLAYLLDPASGEILETIEGLKVRYTADGSRRVVACSEGGRRVIVEDVATKTMIREIPVRGTAAAAMELSPDGRYAALMMHGGFVTLCDLITGEVGQFRPAETGSALTFTADGRRLAIGDNVGRLVVTDLDGNPLNDISRSLGSRVCDAVACPHSNQLIVTTSRDLQFINLDTSPGQHSVPLTPIPPVGVIGTFSDDGQQYACRDKDGLLLFDTDTGQQRLRIAAPSLRISKLLTNGQFVAVIDPDGRLHVWDAATGTPVEFADSTFGRCTFCALHSDQPLLAAAFEDDSAKIFQLAEGTLASIGSVPHPVEHMAFLPTSVRDHALAVVTKQTRSDPFHQLLLLDVESSDTFAEIQLADFGRLTQMMAHPHMPYVALITPRDIRLVDLNEQRAVWSLETRMMSCGSLHPTDPLLVTMSGDRMHFFDTRNGERLGELASGVSYANCRFDSSGEHLISATRQTIEFREGTPDTARADQLGVPAFLRSSPSANAD